MMAYWPTPVHMPTCSTQMVVVHKGVAQLGKVVAEQRNTALHNHRAKKFSHPSTASLFNMPAEGGREGQETVPQMDHLKQRLHQALRCGKAAVWKSSLQAREQKREGGVASAPVATTNGPCVIFKAASPHFLIIWQQDLETE